MRFLKNKLTVTVIVLSVSFLILIGYTVGKEKMSTAGNGVGVVLNSVQGVVYKFNSKLKKSAKFMFHFKDVKEENKRLREENVVLKDKALKYDSLAKENERFKKMVNFKDQRSEYDYIGCEIIGKSGENWLDGFVINRGSDDGIQKKMVVATGEGLVGQVTSVANKWSIVQSIINENIQVAGMLNSTRENDGVVKGYKDYSNKLLAKLYFLPLDSKVKKGDTVLTSALGSLYPKDIKIGTVIDVEEDKGKLVKNALIEPSVDFNRLEELFVVVSKNKDGKY
ncbi:rod shape-determining protein MreC [Clostridium botulinum]|uniref:Cell shape-determining protein MreC n=1 Tax=Clostridium botulinum C/D str. DC5 TaxID=1443128 RepID=A0A0A0IGX8_CLOBO|nr:rod shape-determining protein MreC [Clostridium botulinum]KGM93605.1 rod shape-determining protein MreC [Clostridium botulinum D str. CCUG 7971]KGM99526.1 rod shape-determining protein MreC [Clostridium botulinum C/D str. DC5]KOC48886.1 rod shape-determining protein MreC [Clostridium botulinum]KOC55823.1 rod shape-determining protein MreC [Clostridium botulinum]KOC56422.1 rod shape-determining protein MreC [Clostridium botulinum]